MDKEAPDHQYSCLGEIAETVEVETIPGPIVEGSHVQVEAVEIVDNSSQPRKSHHTGPIPEGYVLDKRARQKTFSKRMKTFIKQAQALHNMCGAEVSVKIKSESGKQIIVELPQVHRRTVKVQTSMGPGNPQESISQRQSVVPPRTHSPKKTPVKTIKNLPGKKKITTSEIKRRINNKCAECGVIFNGKGDMAKRKKHGKKDTTWIGCDHDGCTYWVHAMCGGIKISSMKSIPSLKFLCPQHK